MKKLQRPRPLSEEALTSIREAIIEGSIELGEQISELQLSRRLEISKTPVREALQELRREGLVSIGPNSGTRVFFPSASELLDLFEFRSLLETGAAHRVFSGNTQAAADALQKIVEQMKAAISAKDPKRYRALDAAFHTTIVRSAENALIVDAYWPISAKIDALRNRGLEDISVVHRSIDFHDRLATLMCDRNEAGFVRVLKEHIDNSSRDFGAWLEHQIGGVAEKAKRA